MQCNNYANVFCTGNFVNLFADCYIIFIFARVFVIGDSSPLFCSLYIFMIKQENIQVLIKDALEERGLFLVEVVAATSGKITVYIDSMNAVTIDDCAVISRLIEKGLDRDEQDYELEVSSPGQERSLILPLQYKKNLGKKVNVLRKDGIRLQGILRNFKGNSVTIESEHMVKNANSAKKKKISKITEVGIDQIKKAEINVS